MLLAMGNEAQAEIDSLRERLAAAEAVAAEVARIKAINADLEARNALLELQNEKMRRTLFGQRSERTRHLLDQMDGFAHGIVTRQFANHLASRTQPLTRFRKASGIAGAALVKKPDAAAIRPRWVSKNLKDTTICSVKVQIFASFSCF